MRSPEDELSALAGQSLLRRLRHLDSPQGPRAHIDGREFLNFSSNDYLGLARDVEIVRAMVEAAERYGAGSGASRLVCGGQSPHLALEEALADFMETEAALSFATGYSAALGTVGALCGKGDVLIADKLCHASLLDAARLSGATLRVFPHNHLDKLEHLLGWATQSAGKNGRVLVATEAVFSMDGDRARLREIVEAKDRHGALLLLDEAHALGIIGASGRGLADAEGLADRIDLRLGTLGKAAGAAGGFVAAKRAVIDLITNKGRSFIYSTAPPPAQAAAARKGIEILASKRGDSLREHLWENIRHFAEIAALPAVPSSAIVPFVLGPESAALAADARLREAGLLVPAIRFPTVARNAARLRITLSAAHSSEEILRLAEELGKMNRE
jgi:8-amino-7-oxononanoate synthase